MLLILKTEVARKGKETNFPLQLLKGKLTYQRLNLSAETTEGQNDYSKIKQPQSPTE